jgi:hypothetical protein
MDVEDLIKCNEHYTGNTLQDQRCDRTDLRREPAPLKNADTPPVLVAENSAFLQRVSERFL